MKKLIVCDPIYLGADETEYNKFCDWLMKYECKEFICKYLLNGCTIHKIFQCFLGYDMCDITLTGKPIPRESDVLAVVEVPEGKIIKMREFLPDKNDCDLYVEIDHISDAVHPDDWDDMDDMDDIEKRNGKKLIVCDPYYLGASDEDWNKFVEWTKKQHENEFDCFYELKGYNIRKMFLHFGGEGLYDVTGMSDFVPVDSGFLAIVEIPKGKRIPVKKDDCHEIDDIDEADYPESDEAWDSIMDDMGGMDDEEYHWQLH